MSLNTPRKVFESQFGGRGARLFITRLTLFLSVACVMSLTYPRVVLGLPLHGCKQEEEKPSSPIKLRILTEKKVYQAGETFDLGLELANTGNQTLLIGRPFGDPTGSWFAEVHVWLEDERGRLSEEEHPFRDAIYFCPDSLGEPGVVIAESFVLLTPGDSFSFRYPAGPTIFEFLRRPGRFQFRARYVALPPEADECDLRVFEQKRYQYFEGEVWAIGVWVDVVPQSDDVP